MYWPLSVLKLVKIPNCLLTLLTKLQGCYVWDSFGYKTNYLLLINA